MWGCWAGNPRDCIHSLAYLAENTPLFHHSIFLLVQSSGYHLPCSGTQTLEFSHSGIFIMPPYDASAPSGPLLLIPPLWPVWSEGSLSHVHWIPDVGRFFHMVPTEDQRPGCHFLTGVRVMQESKLQIEAPSSDEPGLILASQTGQFPWHVPFWQLWG